jgi:hypothetical protein
MPAPHVALSLVVCAPHDAMTNPNALPMIAL